jgi:hypothetical protein
MVLKPETDINLINVELSWWKPRFLMLFRFISDLVPGVVGPEGSLHLLIHWTGIAGKNKVFGYLIKDKLTLIFEIIIENRIHRGKF